MRHVVFNAMVLGANIVWVDIARGGQVFLDSPEMLQCPVAVESKTGHADSVEKFCGDAGPGITGNGDVINIFDGQSGFRQAVPDGVWGEARRVLHTIEPLFLYSSYQPAITNKCRRRISVISVNSKNVHIILIT